MGSWDWVIDILKTQGIGGVALFFSATANVVLFNRLMAIQEKRVQEGREVIKAIENNTAAADAQGDTIEAFMSAFNTLVGAPRSGRGK